jgi:hypothetical protein
MYQVIVILPEGGLSITLHSKAIDAFSKAFELKKVGATFYVEDRDSVRLSETELVARMPDEAGKK